MTADVDIYGAAALMRRSASWMQRHWRQLVAKEGFPAPFVGGERYASPWWRVSAIEAWKDGRRTTQAQPAAEQSSLAPANDPTPNRQPGRRVNALLAAAGGGR